MNVIDAAFHARISTLLSFVEDDDGNGVNLYRRGEQLPLGAEIYPLFDADPERPRSSSIAVFPVSAASAAEEAAKAMPTCTRLTVKDSEGILLVLAWSQLAEENDLMLHWAESADIGTWDTRLIVHPEDFTPWIQV